MRWLKWNMQSNHNGGGSKRVLHVLNELRYSGAEVMVMDAEPELQAMGYSTAVLSTGAEVGEAARSFAELGIDIFHIPFRKRIGFVRSVACLGREFDLVHLHSERASFWLSLSLRLTRTPVVRTIHSSFHFTGALRGVRRLQRRTAAAFGVRYLAIGKEVANNEAERFGLRTIVVPNWASGRYLEIQQRREYASVPRVLVTIGNCGEPKNHQALIRAVGHMVSNGQDIEYLHVGSEERADVDEQALAALEGCTDVVTFVGPSDSSRALANADIFVMPSTREGFGLAALEALMSGIPCILADAPGLREFRDVPGIWWCSPEPESIESAIQDVLRTPRRFRQQRALAASTEVQTKYSRSTSLHLLAEAYRSSLSSKALAAHKQ